MRTVLGSMHGRSMVMMRPSFTAVIFAVPTGSVIQRISRFFSSIHQPEAATVHLAWQKKTMKVGSGFSPVFPSYQRPFSVRGHKRFRTPSLSIYRRGKQTLAGPADIRVSAAHFPTQRTRTTLMYPEQVQRFGLSPTALLFRAIARSCKQGGTGILRRCRSGKFLDAG